MNRDEGAYFLSHVYDSLLMSLDSHQTGSQMKKFVAHDGRNCQVSVKGTISDPKFQTSLFSEPPDFFCIFRENIILINC